MMLGLLVAERVSADSISEMNTVFIVSGIWRYSGVYQMGEE